MLLLAANERYHPVRPLPVRYWAAWVFMISSRAQRILLLVVLCLCVLMVLSPWRMLMGQLLEGKESRRGTSPSVLLNRLELPVGLWLEATFQALVWDHDLLMKSDSAQVIYTGGWVSGVNDE